MRLHLRITESVHRSPLVQMLPSGVFLFCLFVAPLALVVTYSLLTRGLYGGVIWEVDLDSYARVFGLANEEAFRDWNFSYLWIISTTAVYAVLTALICVCLGYPLAWYISDMAGRWKYALLFIVVLPFFANSVARVYAWFLILRREGVLNSTLSSFGIISEPLQVLYTPTAVVLGLVYQFLPFVILPLFVTFEGLDRRLIEASRDLGATALQTFWRVIFPATKAGILSAFVLVFIPSLGSYLVPVLMGGSRDLVIGTLLAQSFLSARDWPFGASVAVILCFIVIAIVIANSRYQSKRGDSS